MVISAAVSTEGTCCEKLIPLQKFWTTLTGKSGMAEEAKSEVLPHSTSTAEISVFV